MSQNLRKRNLRYEPKGHVNNDQLTYLPSSLMVLLLVGLLPFMSLYSIYFLAIY